jgi:hypothetical protein
VNAHDTAHRSVKTQNNVGLANIAVDFSASTPTPPTKKGYYREIRITKLAGPGTTASFNVYEGTAGVRLLKAQGLVAFPVSVVNDHIYYETPGLQNFTVEVATNDGAATTNVQIEVTTGGL